MRMFLHRTFAIEGISFPGEYVFINYVMEGLECLEVSLLGRFNRTCWLESIHS